MAEDVLDEWRAACEGWRGSWGDGGHELVNVGDRLASEVAALRAELAARPPIDPTMALASLRRLADFVATQPGCNRDLGAVDNAIELLAARPEPIGHVAVAPGSLSGMTLERARQFAESQNEAWGEEWKVCALVPVEDQP